MAGEPRPFTTRWSRIRPPSAWAPPAPKTSAMWPARIKSRGSKKARAGARAARAFLLPRLFIRAGHIADVFGAGGAHALGGLIRDHRVVNGLGSPAIFDEREFHFVFALAFSLDVFNCNFHGSASLLFGFDFFRLGSFFSVLLAHRCHRWLPTLR